VRGDSLELELTVKPGSAKRFGVKVRCSPDGAEETAIWCDFSAGTLAIDFAKSSLDTSLVYRTFVMKGGDNPAVTKQVSPFVLAAGEPLRLRVFLDRSIVEVFANRRQCVTQRIYPTRADSVEVVLVSEGGECDVESLSAWEMAATNAW
jgi:sucrose-6-phosphate hydrolase SacC (GH32 family)